MKLQEYVWHIISAMEDANYPFNASPEVEDERYEICQACEHYVEEAEACKECECYVPMKCKQCWDYCPIGKWDRDMDAWYRYYNRFKKVVLKKYPEAEEWTNQ